MSMENRSNQHGYVSYRFERPQGNFLGNNSRPQESYFTDFPCAGIDREAGVAYILVSAHDSASLEEREVKLKTVYGLSEVFTGLGGQPEIATRADPQQEWKNWKKVS